MQVEKWITFVCFTLNNDDGSLFAASHSCAVRLSHCQGREMQAVSWCCLSVRISTSAHIVCPVSVRGWYCDSRNDCLSTEHQLQQIADNSQQSAVFTWQYEENTKKIPVCPCMYIWRQPSPKSSTDTSKVTLMWSCTQSLRFRWTCCKVTRQIWFRSESASYHSSRLEPFCMATPRQAPCGGSARKAVGQAEPSPHTDGRMLAVWATGWILLACALCCHLSPVGRWS